MANHATSSRLWTGVIVGLIIGALAGLYGSRYFTRTTAPAEVTPPALPLAAQVREVELDLYGGTLHYHNAVVVNVGRGDKVRWVTSRPELRDFKLTITRDKEIPGLAPTPDPPRNPFGTSGTEPAEWQATNGVLELGPALPRARGHQYKFTIEAGTYRLDPHIIFESHEDSVQ